MPNFKIGDRVYHIYGRYTATIDVPYRTGYTDDSHWLVLRDDGLYMLHNKWWIARDALLTPAPALSLKRSVDIALDRLYAGL